MPWLAAALVPLLIIHLVDYQRSVVAAAVAFVLLSGGLALRHATLYDAWAWLPAVAPFLLWSLNGVRAVHADRTMG